MPAGRPRVIWLILLLVPLAACRGDGGREAEPALGRATTEAQRKLDEKALPKPVLDACDLIAAMAARAKGTTVTRIIGRIEDEFERRERNGCGVTVDGSFTALGDTAEPLSRMREEFEARGWHEDVARSADGPDGTTFGFVRDAVICFFRGQWDGGDDSDPTYEPDDRFTVWGRCAVVGS